MARLVHYVFKTPNTHPRRVHQEHMNHRFGGVGPLTNYQLELVKRRLAQKHSVPKQMIVVCNVMDLKGEDK